MAELPKKLFQNADHWRLFDLDDLSVRVRQSEQDWASGEILRADTHGADMQLWLLRSGDGRRQMHILLGAMAIAAPARATLGDLLTDRLTLTRLAIYDVPGWCARNGCPPEEPVGPRRNM